MTTAKAMEMVSKPLSHSLFLPFPSLTSGFQSTRPSPQASYRVVKRYKPTEVNPARERRITYIGPFISTSSFKDHAFCLYFSVRSFIRSVPSELVYSYLSLKSSGKERFFVVRLWYCLSFYSPSDIECFYSNWITTTEKKIAYNNESISFS